MAPDTSVLDDNPFDGSLVHSYGHRNPQGIAWDEEGTMYASEFGQNIWDELNVIEPGANYCWPKVEGIGDNDPYVDPIHGALRRRVRPVARRRPHPRTAHSGY